MDLLVFLWGTVYFDKRTDAYFGNPADIFVGETSFYLYKLFVWWVVLLLFYSSDPLTAH